MKSLLSTLFTSLALAPFAAMGQLTLTGPAGTLVVDNTFGNYEPLDFVAPVSGIDVLFQNAFFVDTGALPYPEEIYFDGALISSDAPGASITLNYALTDVDVTVQFAPFTAPYAGVPVTEWYLMVAQITNTTGDVVSGLATNYLDFGPDPDGGDDLLEVISPSGLIGFKQTIADTGIEVFSLTFPAGEDGSPTTFEGGLYPNLVEDLFDLPLGPLASGPVPLFPADWSFAFSNSFELEPGEFTEFGYVIGIAEPTIPEPSVAALLGLPLVGLLIGLRRRRA